jgi:hypothetical protein
MQYLSLSFKKTDPFQAGSIGSIILRDGSPARGVIWVENNGPVVFRSPVGTKYGYFDVKNTHISSLTGLRKHRKSPFATHISPLTGLLAKLKTEPIAPAWKGSTFQTSENLTFFQRKVEY